MGHGTHLVCGDIPGVDQCVMNLGPLACIPAELGGGAFVPDFEKGFMQMNLAHVTPRRSIGPTLESAVIGYHLSKLRGKICQEPSRAGVYAKLSTNLYGVWFPVLTTVPQATIGHRLLEYGSGILGGAIGNTLSI